MLSNSIHDAAALTSECRDLYLFLLGELVFKLFTFASLWVWINDGEVLVWDSHIFRELMY